MDNMPVRGGSSAAHRPTQSARATAERAPTQDDESRLPRYNHQTHGQAPQKDQGPKRKIWLWGGVGAGVVALIIVLVALFFMRPSASVTSSSIGIDSSKYQAVFFTNGQVYFGKLNAFTGDYLKLTDVYYLQTQQAEQDAKNPQKTATDQSNVQLTKLGGEIHGPQDEMIISKDQVLFYENLKSDGKVATSIAKFKGSK